MIFKDCGDLSQLWYREFYLEMTMGKRIQVSEWTGEQMSRWWSSSPSRCPFPGSSLTTSWRREPPPTLSASSIPSTSTTTLHSQLWTCSGKILGFNDPWGFFSPRKQFLFDEVEAEVNLCFDQFVFKLSEQVMFFMAINNVGMKGHTSITFLYSGVRISQIIIRCTHITNHIQVYAYYKSY